jgi:hypothetical protein
VRVLLDEQLPHQLRLLLTHDVVTVAYMGWAGLKNGALLRAAEEAGFEVMVTSDRGIPYEQNLAGRKLALVMLSTADLNMLKTEGLRISEAIDKAMPGSIIKVDCGKPARRRPKPEGPKPS